jgi:hypothetical protein
MPRGGIALLLLLLLGCCSLEVAAQSGDYKYAEESAFINALNGEEGDDSNSNSIAITTFCQQLETAARNSGIFVGGKLCAGFNAPDISAAEKYMASYAPKGLERNPIILVPGLGGSALELELHEKDVPHWYCTKNIDYFRAWLHLDELLPGVFDCFSHNMKLQYDPGTHHYSNIPGVQSRPADFGGLRGIDYLDYMSGKPVTLTGYYATVISNLESAGYVGGVDLYGAPYDWRVPSSALYERNEWYAQLKELILTARRNNQGKKVNLVTHSMGGPTIATFLAANVTFAEENVANFIPIAAPWMGAAKAIIALLYGDNFGIAIGDLNLISPLKLREIIRTFGGATYMTPEQSFYGNQTFVTWEGKDYHAGELGALLEAFGAEGAATLWQATQHMLAELQAPSIPTTCLYGTGVPTEIAYSYASSDKDTRPTATDTNQGDGTVPLESLRVCQDWKNAGAAVEIEEFNERDHVGILKDPQVIAAILKVCTTPIV